MLLPGVASASTANAGTTAVSPDGARVYVGFNGAGFSVFSRDPSTGRLSLLGQAPTPSSAGPLVGPSIAVSPDSATVYGVDAQSNQMLQYGTAQGRVVTQGAYPVLPDLTVAKDPSAVTASPDGSSVYVLTYGVQFGSGIGVTSDGKINAFQRDPSTGHLTLVGTTRLNTDPDLNGAVGSDPVVSPDGKFVYVASISGVYVLSRDTTTGALTMLGRDGDLNAAVAIAVSPDGKFVYEAGPGSSSSASNVISVLSRDPATGRLTPVSQVQNGAGGVSGLSDMWSAAVSPDGRCVYATSRTDGSLGSFTRDPTSGALTFDGLVSEGSGGAAGLAGARGVSVSPDSQNIYVASPTDGGGAVFARDAATCAPTFVQLAQDLFTLEQPTTNPSDGTATLPVDVSAAGTLDATVTPVGTQVSAHAETRDAPAVSVSPGRVNLPVRLTGLAEQQLDTLHRLTVNVAVTFTAGIGAPTTKTTVVQVVKNPSSSSRAPTVSLTHFRVSPRTASLAGVRVRGRCVAPTHANQTHQRCRRPVKLRVSYTLSTSARVTVTVARQAPGRAINRRCVPPTTKNRKHSKCTRLLPQRGRITLAAAKRGANAFVFAGKIGGHRLSPGTYQLTATPIGGKAKHATFAIRP